MHCVKTGVDYVLVFNIASFYKRNMEDMEDMEEKKLKVAKFARKDSDTGSPEAQICLLTERIKHLTGHMQGHKKDLHSRRGLLMLVSKRKKLMQYLARKDYKKYEEVSTALNIRHG